uniref:Putative RNA polymerase sigma factor n=2 Tax=Streptomyces sp. F11 TaxID=319318 RepID=V9QG70_9ACTN|nr:putative RNA polymerase sigma factor [Streptomyces sp. F11]
MAVASSSAGPRVAGGDQPGPRPQIAWRCDPMPKGIEVQALAVDLTAIYANQHARVLGIVGRTLRPEDRAAYVDDLAQDVWLMVWQYLLRGNEIRNASGLLAVFARRRVYAHYRSARVRREQATDPTSLALDRLCADLEAIA